MNAVIITCVISSTIILIVALVRNKPARTIKEICEVIKALNPLYGFLKKGGSQSN